MQRLVIITYDPLDTSYDFDYEGMARDWTISKHLSSMLQPDFQQLLWKGELDIEAMTDWSQFVNAMVKTTRSRNAAMWSYVGYYMCLLEFIAGGQMEDVFRFISRMAIEQHYVANKHGDLLHQFIIAIEKARTCAGPLTNDVSKCIFWHSSATDVTRTSDTLSLQCRDTNTRIAAHHPRSHRICTPSRCCQIIAPTS